MKTDGMQSCEVPTLGICRSAPDDSPVDGLAGVGIDQGPTSFDVFLMLRYLSCDIREHVPVAVQFGRHF